MAWPIKPVRFSCALIAWVAAAPVIAAGTEFSAEFGLGAEYDSNVSVDELDATSNESDYAYIADADLGFDQQLGEKVDLSLNYNVSQTNYDRFERLDRTTHLVGADLGADLGAVNTGMALYYINAQLDGNDFLEYYRGSPYVSGFLAKKWFARGAYVYSDKTIAQNPDRDAESHAGEFDLYFFRRGLRSYFNAGYKFKDEDATAERYDYKAHNVKLRYIHRFDLWGDVLKMEFSWRYEDRDYSGITPSIDEERADQRHRWKIDMEYPLSERTLLQIYGGYSDYDSNFPRAAYDQHVVGTRLSWRWE
ncbi:surface lipoprotein assembly modifier [Halioglobus japonicus]|uniref:surface lipoprotein assembly modifier n=1 Tax=Halioglobus japonicus TaxID=930805 RepID=UPI0011AECD25|nr:surface lipoprotein assembly modifier [Halioglobus japonicus]